MYQSKARQWEENPHIRVEINGLQALEVERVVSKLPDKYREIIRWCYVWPWVPVGKMRRELALTLDGVVQTLDGSRDMVKNNLLTRNK
jgi:hypothetical protein